MLQIPFRPLIRNKILVWHDWLYYSELKKRNDTLYLNSLIPWKGFYLKKNDIKKTKNILNKIFPIDLVENYLQKNSLKEKLSEMKITWDEKLIFLLERTIEKTYSDNIEKLKYCYNSFHEIYLSYSPKSIIFLELPILAT